MRREVSTITGDAGVGPGSEEVQSDCVVPPGDDWWFEPDPRLDSEGNRVEAGRGSVRCPNTGAKIRAARLAADLSQEELARAVGVSKESIRIMEKGEIVPSTAAFLELEDALGVAMPDLMDREEIRAQGRKTTARRSRSGKARARS